jgi:hypothetical protein
MIKKTILMLVVAAAGLSMGFQQQATASINVAVGGATFTSTVNPSVRYKGFANDSNRRSYVGQADLGVGGNRSEQTASWLTSNTFTFTFDGVQGVTSTTNSNGTISKTITADPGSLNAIQLRVRNQNTGTVTLSSLTINGDSTFSPATTFSATNAQNYWTLSGFDLSAGFTITGTITLSGTMANNESSQVEMNVGYNSAYSVVPEPGTLLVWGFGAAIGMIGARRRRLQAPTV